MATSAYILPHQPGATATPAPTVSGVDQLKLLSKLPKPEKTPKVGDTKVFFDTPEGKVTALVSLGDKFASKKLNEQRELVRRAVGSAVKQLRDLDGVNHAEIDASTDPHAAGEYSHQITGTTQPDYALSSRWRASRQIQVHPQDLAPVEIRSKSQTADPRKFGAGPLAVFKGMGHWCQVRGSPKLGQDCKFIASLGLDLIPYSWLVDGTSR